MSYFYGFFSGRIPASWAMALSPRSLYRGRRGAESLRYVVGDLRQLVQPLGCEHGRIRWVGKIETSGHHTHRIHVWYANIGGILMVNVAIYGIHTDPMG